MRNKSYYTVCKITIHEFKMVINTNVLMLRGNVVTSELNTVPTLCDE